MLIQYERRTKLESKSQQMILLGYSDTGYIVKTLLQTKYNLVQMSNSMKQKITSILLETLSLIFRRTLHLIMINL